MLKYSQANFENFSKKVYPNGWQYKAENETRDVYVGKNSQIIVNEMPVKLLFIGDSITYRFETSAYFGKYGVIVNRGIGGETLSHLVGRFKEDCLDLHPGLAIVGSGVNDTGALWRLMNNGQEVTEQLQKSLLIEMEGNYRKIVADAKKANVNIWLASVLPLGTSDFRSKLIIRINSIIQKICDEEKLVYIDYYSKMTKDDGITLKDVTFGDDLHPHVKGYNIMYEVLNDLLIKEGII